MTLSAQAGQHLFAPGHAGCPGCGPSIALKLILDALGKDIIVVNATGCMEITTTNYPRSAWRVPYIHSVFENAPAVASGVASALEVQGNTHTKVVAIVGDGCAYDIGFGALSGMASRNDNVLFICYDNENYANTGVQQSGATPYGARTTTSEVGAKFRGKQQERKQLVEIMAMHSIPYSASASIGFIPDLQKKLLKAKEITGTRFIDVHAPCALGAGFDGKHTIPLAKKAVLSGLWFLFEYEKEKFTLNFDPKELADPKDYLMAQKRFRHLDEKQLTHIKGQAKKNYERIKWLCGMK